MHHKKAAPSYVRDIKMQMQLKVEMQYLCCKPLMHTLDYYRRIYAKYDSGVQVCIDVLAYNFYLGSISYALKIYCTSLLFLIKVMILLLQYMYLVINKKINKLIILLSAQSKYYACNCECIFVFV